MNDDADAETSKIINKYIHILLLAFINKSTSEEGIKENEKFNYACTKCM